MADQTQRCDAGVPMTVAPTPIVDLPIQRSQREALLNGMCGIIRRMTRVSGAGVLCLVDHDERELAIELFGYLEGVRRHE